MTSTEAEKVPATPPKAPETAAAATVSTPPAALQQKQATPPQPSMGNASISSDLGTPTSSQRAAHAKSLNVNAKSFVPKLDPPDLQQPSRSPAKAGQPVPTPTHGLPPGMPPFGGMPAMMGLSPMNFLPPFAGSPSMLGMRPPPGIPFMAPSPSSGSMSSSGVSAPPVPPAAFFNTQPASPLVTVGNASLAATRSTVPPKFACVLLVGVTGVGKTTLGRQLVQELSDDKINWAFFSGGDHMKDSPSRPAPWETTRVVLDALAQTLDALLAKQATNPIRGLVIDKQCRGVEDLYYLTSMLRQRGLLLWGILGLDVPNDEVLCARLGGSAESGMKEKIKYHRVVESRITEAAKSVHLWRTVDSSASRNEVVKVLRTMVLGCSSQSPTKQLQPSMYHESSNTLVDNYTTYGNVMTTLFACHKSTTKGYQFPGFVGYQALPLSVIEDKKKNVLKDYTVRRKVDGTKYVLLFDGSSLYLIPRHMRCVFEMPQEAWLGVPLANMGRFILDGELVKMSKERSKEKFVVYDVLFLSEKGSGINLVARAGWKERQERLKVNLCSETTAFFPKKGEVVVVHQSSEELKVIPQLLEPCDYPSDGLIFQPTARREDPTYMWRPPENVNVDFRLGSSVVSEDGARRIFQLELFDQKLGRYAQFKEETVDVGGPNRPQAIEGAIAVCVLDMGSDGSVHWVFLRTRCDVQIAAMKASVEELLQDCLIPKRTILTLGGAAAPSTAPQSSSAPLLAPQLGTQAQPPHVPTPHPGMPHQQPPQQQQPRTVASSVTEASRLAFGSALPPGQTAPAPQPKPQSDGLLTDAQKLSQLSVPVKVQQVPASGNSTVAALESLLLGGRVTVAREQEDRQAQSQHRGGSDRDRDRDRDHRDRDRGDSNRGYRGPSDRDNTHRDNSHRDSHRDSYRDDRGNSGRYRDDDRRPRNETRGTRAGRGRRVRDSHYDGNGSTGEKDATLPPASTSGKDIPIEASA